jgi:hypothetical protein
MARRRGSHELYIDKTEGGPKERKDRKDRKKRKEREEKSKRKWDRGRNRYVSRISPEAS